MKINRISVESALAALARLLPSHATVLREGIAVQLASEQLVPGDIVLLQEGDRISADCRVIESHGLRVNEATVTGESAACDKDAREAAGDDLLASRNVVLAGTLALAMLVADEARKWVVRYRAARHQRPERPRSP